MGYGKCIENGVSGGPCGMYSNNTVGVWTSMDLTHGSWKRASLLRMSSDGWPKCTYYRSHAAYSKATKKYVLWLNAEPGRDSDCAACADPESGKSSHCYLAGTSDSPSGPFEYHGVVPVRYTYDGGVGDFELFVDDDLNSTGTCYHGVALATVRMLLSIRCQLMLPIVRYRLRSVQTHWCRWKVWPPHDAPAADA